MIEEFIKNHRKLTILISVIITGVILFLLLSSLTNNSSVVDDGLNNDGIDGLGEQSTLQYRNSLYTIAFTDEKKDTITVTAYEGYRTAAVDVMYDFGLDPTDYKFIFNYESPFKAYE